MGSPDSFGGLPMSHNASMISPSSPETNGGSSASSIKGLSTRIQELELENQGLQRKIISLMERISHLSSTRQMLQDDLRVEREQVRQLRERLKERTAEVDQLRGKSFGDQET